MQRQTSIGSRITAFAFAAIILFTTWSMGLRLLPAARDVYASFGAKLPTWNHVVFTFGPAVLVSVGLIAAVLTVMGEYKPALRGVRPLLIVLVVVLTGSSLGAVFFVPFLSCGEVIDRSAPALPSSTLATNAP